MPRRKRAEPSPIDDDLFRTLQAVREIPEEEDDFGVRVKLDDVAYDRNSKIWGVQKPSEKRDLFEADCGMRRRNRSGNRRRNRNRNRNKDGVNGTDSSKSLEKKLIQPMKDVKIADSPVNYQQQQQQPKQSILGQPPYASQMYNQLYSHPYNAVQPQYQQQQQHAHDVASFVSPIEQPSWKVDAPDFAPSLSANASEYTPSFAISSPVTAVDIDVGNAGVDTGAVVAPSLNIGVISDGKCDASAINEKVDTISDSTIAAIEMIADDDDEKEKEEEKQKKNDLKEDIVTEDNEKSDSTEPNQQQHQSEDGSETIQVPEGIEQFICENALMMMQDEDGSFVVVVEEMDDDIASIRVLESNDQLDIMSEDLVAILPSPGDTVQVRELSSRGVVTSVERHAIEGYVMGVSFIDDNLPKSEKFGKFPCYDIVKLFLAV